MLYVNQLEYRDIPYQHNMAHGGAPEDRRNVATSGCGLCSACMIVDGSDTIFYMAGVYFGGLKLKKVWLAIVLALIVSLVGASLGCLLCKVM